MTARTQTATEPRLSAVVVSFNTRDDLLRCIRSLEDAVSLPIEIIVVDNASSDGSVAAVQSTFPEVRTIANSQNLGFSRANNQGLRAARGAYVLILNSDAEVRPGSVEAMAALLDREPEAAVVGPRTLNSDGTPQVSYGPALTPLAEWRQRRLVRSARRRDPRTLRRLEEESRHPRCVDWVSGSCMLARRDALAAIGGFDEDFFLYEEDVDLCIRVRESGRKVVFTGHAEIVHHLGSSVGQALDRSKLEYHRSHLLYYRKHNGRLWTVLLRLLLGLRAAFGLLRLTMQPAQRRGPQLRQQRALLGLAWRGK
jgi:GT2 family glycosyltransferase